MSDLSDLAVPDTAQTFEVRHPASQKTVLFIDLLPVTAPAPALVKRKQDKRRFDTLARKGKLSTTPEEAEANGLDLLAACTVGWRDADGNVPTYKGQAFPCTPQNVRTLYTDMPWVRDEVDRFLGDVSNFLAS